MFYKIIIVIVNICIYVGQSVISIAIRSIRAFEKHLQ
jgi:hypothetical protein